MRNPPKTTKKESRNLPSTSKSYTTMRFHKPCLMGIHKK